MAWIWVSSSPSTLPAATVRLTPRSFEAFVAPSAIFLKKEVPWVLMISETDTFLPSPPAEASFSDEQAVRAVMSSAALEAARTFRVSMGVPYPGQ
ncbi:hypothetical protein [Micromonospora sp. NBS 11-29]|uniref:hypothetical protein n=1 Tax=Micromonospora sp. NBS 11-29 TaxID=1960879 RepID=UPI003F8FE943